MIETIDDDHPVDTKEMSALLTREGFPTAEATLTKLRCIGGGPEYLKFGRMVRYRPSKGRAWAARRTIERRCTSDATQIAVFARATSPNPKEPTDEKL
jgi:hypothetical protein